MRRFAVISALALCFVLGFAVTAPAAGPPILKATPRTVHLGHTVTIKGSQWPVIEFCKRTVRLRLESAQNAVLIGFAHISDGGARTPPTPPLHAAGRQGRHGHVEGRRAAAVRERRGRLAELHHAQEDAEDQAVVAGSNCNCNCGWVGRCRERASISSQSRRRARRLLRNAPSPPYRQGGEG